MSFETETVEGEHVAQKPRTKSAKHVRAGKASIASANHVTKNARRRSDGTFLPLKKSKR
jgi:hypothetical protein